MIAEVAAEQSADVEVMAAAVAAEEQPDFEAETWMDPWDGTYWVSSSLQILAPCLVSWQGPY